MGKTAKDKQQQSGTSLLEWLAAATGAAIAILLIGFIAGEAIQTADGRPPMIEVRPLRTVAGGGVHVVEVEVANRSGKTAASVAIVGELKDGGSVVESSNATMTYVPGNSIGKAGLIFSRDPRRYTLKVRASGYEEP